MGSVLAGQGAGGARWMAGHPLNQLSRGDVADSGADPAVDAHPSVIQRLPRSGQVRQGQRRGSTWNSVWAAVLFVVGWAVTLPLWLIRSRSVLTTVLDGLAQPAHFYYDALAEHATPEEWRELRRQAMPLLAIGICHGGPDACAVCRSAGAVASGVGLYPFLSRVPAPFAARGRSDIPSRSEA